VSKEGDNTAQEKALLFERQVRVNEARERAQRPGLHVALARFPLILILSASLSRHTWKKNRCIYISRLVFVSHCLVSTLEAPKNLYIQTSVVVSDHLLIIHLAGTEPDVGLPG